jgi:DNA primase
MSTAAEEVKSKLDIVELVAEYVRLNPAGGVSMKGLCPFHTEKTPSFYVHGGDKQFWHCFGCSEGGDAFTFYQKIENVEFTDALKDLARRAGVELKSFDLKTDSERAKLIEVLEDAAAYYSAALKHDVGARARAYLEKRGIKEETIAEFRLGYAPNSWDATVKALATKGHEPEKLAAAGLAIASDKGRGHYDRFRDRIMIPLRDEKGKVVGFTGRIMPDSPEADKTGKYVNTPETLVYRKRRLVYALDRAKNQIKNADFAVLVEGNMDAVSSHQAGIKNVVAVSGTAFSEEQIDLLKRYASRIALAFDADVAGQNAITRALPHAWKSGMQVLVVKLPEGYKDPDEVIAKDPELWRQAIAGAKDMVEYAVGKALEGFNPGDPFSKKKALAALKPIFRLLEDPVLHDHWIHVLAERLTITDEAVRAALSAPAKPQGAEGPAHEAPEIETREERLAKRLFSIILANPKEFKAISADLDEGWFPTGSLATLAKKLKAYYAESSQSALGQKGFFESYVRARDSDPALPPIEPIVLLKERDMAEWTEEQLREEASACLRELEKLHRKRAAKELLAALGAAEKRGDVPEANAIARRLEELMKSASF